MFFKETFPPFLIEDSQEGLFLLKASAVVHGVRWGNVALEVVLHEEVEFHQVVSVEPNLVLPPTARGVAESGGPIGVTSRPWVGIGVCRGSWRWGGRFFFPPCLGEMTGKGAGGGD